MHVDPVDDEPVFGRPETSEALTAERLHRGQARPACRTRGRLAGLRLRRHLHLINLGDSAEVRARKELDARIDRQFEGGRASCRCSRARAASARPRSRRSWAWPSPTPAKTASSPIDANPDRGTLSERVAKQTRATVRDVVTGPPRSAASPTSRRSSRATRPVSTSWRRDTDPLLSEAFDENDYNVVADLAARFYSIVLTDCGTGIVHSVMRATLQRADSIVIVSGGSVDEARLASETAHLARGQRLRRPGAQRRRRAQHATQGTNLVKLEEIEAHFRSRVREIVRIPYDPQLAAGSVDLVHANCGRSRRDAARDLAALVARRSPSVATG